MIPEEHVEYVDQDDLDVYVANHPFVLVHWYESVLFWISLLLFSGVVSAGNSLQPGVLWQILLRKLVMISS